MKGVIGMLLELNKCPHCGEDATLCVYSTDEGKKLYLIRCENCGCGTCTDENVGTLVQLWNSRVCSLCGKNDGSNDEDDEDYEKVSTVYISLPEYGLTNKEKCEIQENLADCVSEYIGETLALTQLCVKDGASGIERMAERLLSIDIADYVVFPDGWEGERECRIDYKVASEYGKNIFFEHGEIIQEEF